MILSLILAVSPVVQPVSSALYRDGGSSLSVTVQGAAEMSLAPGATGAFGEPLVSNQYVESSLAFPYYLNPEIAWIDGGVSYDAPFAIVSNPDGGYAEVRSKHVLRYLPGQGVEARFTAVWPYGAARDGGHSEIGVGTQTDGLFFGTCASCGLDGGASFGVLRRSFGVDHWVPQESWNLSTRPALDITKGSPYRIQYQWLGFGQIQWSIEDPLTGAFMPVHVLRWANTSSTTTMRNPNLPLRVASWGTTVRTPSMSHIRQGVDNTQGVRQTHSDTATANASAEVVVFSLRNEGTFLSLPNTVTIAPDHMSAVHRGTAAQSVVLRLRRDCTLTPASSWVARSNSPVSTDTTSTACANGRELMSFAVDQGTHDFDLRPYLLELYPGESLSVTAISVTGTPDLVVAIAWRDLL